MHRMYTPLAVITRINRSLVVRNYVCFLFARTLDVLFIPEKTVSSAP